MAKKSFKRNSGTRMKPKGDDQDAEYLQYNRDLPKAAENESLTIDTTDEVSNSDSEDRVDGDLSESIETITMHAATELRKATPGKPDYPLDAFPISEKVDPSDYPLEAVEESAYPEPSVDDEFRFGGAFNIKKSKSKKGRSRAVWDSTTQVDVEDSPVEDAPVEDLWHQ